MSEQQLNPNERGSENSAYNAVVKTKNWISNSLGIIILVVGLVAMFVVASLEGSREIRVSNQESGALMNIWKEENPDRYTPRAKVDMVVHDGETYYYMVDEDGEWYWAHEGGFGYVFQSYRWYFLTFVATIITIFVAQTNYKLAVSNGKKTPHFSSSMKYYGDSKTRCAPYVQYIPEFCTFKNEQSYINAKRDIIEEAGVNYETYIKNEKDLSVLYLDDWQKKILKNIEKIKINRLKPQDLLQEAGSGGVRISLLPMGEQEHQDKFLKSSIIQKSITTAFSGTAISFGIVLGNWTLGLIYGAMIFISYISAIVIGTDYASTTLRNRYIAKADLLNEFYNTKDNFIKKEEDKPILNKEEKVL